MRSAAVPSLQPRGTIEPSDAHTTARVRVDWRALILAGGGLALVFAAPGHRADLLLIGLVFAAAGAIWNPAAALVVVGASLPAYFFGRPLIGPLSVTPFGLALMLAWPACLLRWRKVGLRWPRTGYDGPLAVFLVGALLSLLVTEYPLLSARELRALIVEPVLFFWLMSAVPGAPVLALSGFLTSAVATALGALVQIPTGIGGTEAEGVRRAQAWYPSPNHLALMLGRALPFLVAAALARWRAMWLPTLIVASAVVLTFSTGGWLGAAAGVVAVLVALGRGRVALWTGGAAAAALVALAGLGLLGVLPQRFDPLRQTGAFRIDLWLSSLEMIRDHPLFGVGLDNFAYLYSQDYLRPGAAAEPNLSHPHNWLLHFWIELGLAGVVAVVWLVYRFWRFARLQRGWLIAGAIGCMADILIHGLVDNSYFLVDLACVFWLSLALVARSYNR